MDKIKCLEKLDSICEQFREIVDILKEDVELRNDSDILNAIDSINEISVEI